MLLRRQGGGRHAHATLLGLAPQPNPRMPGSANGGFHHGRVVVVVAVLVLLLLAIHADRDLTTRDKCNQTIEVNEPVSSPDVTPENRGLPMRCLYRIRINPDRHDWIITIRFHRFKVGRLMNATTCIDGYVQIKDGSEYRGSPMAPPGYFCGEVDRPQAYISETSYVTIVFHVNNFSEGNYISFDSRAEQKFELFARYGSNPQLYSDRRGRLIQGTFCDRVFHDCRMGSCLIQSPGYPGIYPRNLRCKYHVSTSTGYIKLYIENEEINVDGQRCEDVILCPNKPVTTQCPYDYISIHDGPTEESQLIGTFCGRGKLPYAITGSGRQLLLVFVTSPAGPLLNTGFNFNVGYDWDEVGATKVNGSCDGTFRRDDNIPSSDRRFYSLATWYHPKTMCSFKILGWQNEIIRLYFTTFRIRRPDSAILDDRGCVETLTVYDAPEADEARILAMFCDSWSPVLQPNQDFVSSGNAMYVRFHSEVGSYAGSSLKFVAQFDYFNAYTHGIPVQNTACDELFPSSKLTSGDFSSPLNRLLFTRQSRLMCTYSFRGNAFPFERVIITLSSVNFTGNSSQPACSNCLDDPVDKIIIEDMAPFGVQRIGCICGMRGRLPRTPSPMHILSSGSTIDVKLFVERDHQLPHKQNAANTLFFKGKYEFLHGPKCGAPVLKARLQGELVYPSSDVALGDDAFLESNDDDAFLESNDLEPMFIRCIWTLLVHPKKSLFLRFESFHLPGDCGVDRMEIKLPFEANEYVDSSVLTICGGTSPLEDLPVITSTMLHAGRVLVEFRSSISAEANFRLVWTEVVQMEQKHVAQAQQSSTQDDCSFFCGGSSNACIPHELVCNGIRNCPLTDSPSASSDEDFDLCRSDVDSVNWLAIGLGAAGGGVLATCFILIVHRCCRKEQDTDPG